MSDIEKNTVNFVPNYDDRLQEPSVLPTKLPALLLNGSSGIAVGMEPKFPCPSINGYLNENVCAILTIASYTAASPCG